MFGFGKKAGPAEPLPLHLYNTASKTVEVFEPLKPGVVKMYSCGPTVYDHVHIGNLRSFLMADILKRTLIYNDYRVEHTINLTDFGHLTSDADSGEDKMMTAIKRANKPVTLSAMKEVAEPFIEAFYDDLAELRILEPTQFTRASEYVRQQINLIETLEAKGYTYETSDGLYFDISKFPKYGLLGNIDVSKMKAGARVEENPEKKHPADFALWKKGLLGWESKWGKGFPGWHIECTAMAFDSLGKQIDIHTGGEDLKYTHHNGEIAQAEAATGKQYVRYWVHNAFISIDDTKISKSLGNSITMRHLIDRGYTGEDYRYWLLMTHYRAAANFTFEALDAAKKALFRLKRHLFEEFGSKKGAVATHYEAQFHAAINHDLDTAKAIALIWDVIKDESLSKADKATTIRHFDSVLGLGLTDDPDAVRRELGVIAPEEVPADIQELLDQREAARVVRNWDEADRLREAINFKGYVVEDTPNGQKISKA